MESSKARTRRVDIGFAGGQVLALRLEDDAFASLRKALESDRSDRWHELPAEDAEVAIDLSQVVYVRRDTAEQRVGFRGA
jgi:hypothetical protein